jgi:hypothetical protein
VRSKVSWALVLLASLAAAIVLESCKTTTGLHESDIRTRQACERYIDDLLCKNKGIPWSEWCPYDRWLYKVNHRVLEESKK